VYGSTNPEWTPTDGQRQQFELSNAPKMRHCMAYGGSGSSKTYGWCCIMALRALFEPSTHLIVRRTFKDCRQSLVVDPRATWPSVMDTFLPGVPWEVNHSDWFITMPCARGGQSTIWLSGLDDQKRADKILGREYATIFVNEASDFLDYNSIVILRTRLRQKTDKLALKVFYDQNPTVKSHWTYREFELGVNPLAHSETIPNHSELYGSIQMNPEMNLGNMGDGYIEMLEAMPERQRKRFLKGVYQDEVADALWTPDDIDHWRVSDIPCALVRKIVAVDPSVNDGKHGDSCGIGYAAQGADGHYYVIEDATLMAHPAVWGRKTVELCDRQDCDHVVVEDNQGGVLAEENVRNAQGGDRLLIERVNARSGKILRAEPVANLYRRGLVHHVGHHRYLEDEMTTYTGKPGQASPNRLDWMVHGVTHLSGCSRTSLSSVARAIKSDW